MLLGAVEPLFVDARDFPEKYSDASLELLDALQSGQKTKEALTTEERKILDLAAMDFASAVPKKTQPPKKPLVVEEDDDEDEPEKEKEASSPEADLPSFWWV